MYNSVPSHLHHERYYPVREITHRWKKKPCLHIYLYGRHFTLITDHKSLTTILGPKKGIPPMAAARLQCWAVCLSAYSYDNLQQHIHGLSRLPLHTVRANGPLPDSSIFNVQQLGSLPVTAMQLAATTSTGCPDRKGC